MCNYSVKIFFRLVVFFPFVGNQKHAFLVTTVTGEDNSILQSALNVYKELQTCGDFQGQE